MLPSLIPGTSLLYSSKDIIQNATVDLHTLSRTLHRIQSDRSSRTKNAQRDNVLRSKVHQRIERMDDLEKDIVTDVQVVSQSIKGCLANDWASFVLEMQDHVTFDTNRMNKILQQLHYRIKSMDQEIAELMASDENFGRFSSSQQQQLLKLSSLESQLSNANKKFSTIKSDLKQLKLDLSDLSHSNHILRQRLNVKVSLQTSLRDKISSLLSDVHMNENKEKELRATLSTLVASSEKLGMLCQQEWNHIITLIAEKTSLEENVRRFRSGEVSSSRKRANKKKLAVVVSEVVQASELDRICKIWAQCTWSNAIDAIKIDSALSWLKKRQDEWRMITSNIGMDVDVDELCQWFTDHEEQNIEQFEQARVLALQKKLISNEIESKSEYRELRSLQSASTPSSSAHSLLQTIKNQTQGIELLEDERRHTYSLLEDIRQGLSEMLCAEELPLDSDLLGSLSDMLGHIEQWTKEALVELYGPFSIPDVAQEDTAPLQIEPPDIERASGSISDEEDPII